MKGLVEAKDPTTARPKRPCLRYTPAAWRLWLIKLLLTSVNDCLQYAHGDQTASNRRLPNPTRKNAFFEWQKGVRDPEARAAVLRRIERMRHGLMGDFKRFGVITELRIDTGPGYRLYIGQKGRVLVVLLLGGDKSTQSKDFDLARRYWNDYETRETAAGRSL